VHDAGAGAHHLHLTPADDALAAGAVLVGHRAGDHIGENLHVAVGMGAEAAAGRDGVVVDDPQRAEAVVLGVVVVGEREGVEAVEPAVVGVAAFVGATEDDGHGGEDDAARPRR
jgi:hypothetical protein